MVEGFRVQPVQVHSPVWILLKSGGQKEGNMMAQEQGEDIGVLVSPLSSPRSGNRAACSGCLNPPLVPCTGTPTELRFHLASLTLALHPKESQSLCKGKCPQVNSPSGSFLQNH